MIPVSRHQISARRPLSIFFILVLTLLLAACGGQDTEAPVAAEEPTAVAETQEEPSAVAEPTETTQEETTTVDGARPAAALPPAERNGMYDAPPEMTIDPETYYYATLNTEKGDIKLQLFADRAPITVNNFVYLARQGYYDNTVFHRVLEGFMAQAGDPTGTGTGGPGYEFEDEFVPGLLFDRPGLLAMANRGPGTNGSQIFITFAPTEHLNNRHTIFGEVIEGSDILEQITLRDPGAASDFSGDLIYSVNIEESEESIQATPTPSPPTPTPTPTPTPFAPTGMEAGERPLAALAPEERANYFNTAPDMVIDSAKEYVATISTTQGDIEVELYAQQAPIAVNNFVVLANLGFYDDTLINQVTPDQFIVLGAPDNNPLNDAGYKINAEVNTGVPAQSGSLAYIPFQRAPDSPVVSSSSQLLVTLLEPPAEVSSEFSFFGQIIGGEEVLTLLSMDDKVNQVTISEP